MFTRSSTIFWAALALVFAARVSAEVTDPATLSASIKRDKAYSLLAPCVNQCLWDVNNNDADILGGDLAHQLSCSAPWPNGCYCRQNYATFAYGFIASCATKLCEAAGNSPQETDIASGQAIYASYCSNALPGQYAPESFSQAPAPTVAAAPEDLSISLASSRKTSTVPKQTGQATPTDGASPDSSTNSSGSQKEQKIMGLSMGAFIGVIVSIVCSVLGLIFGIAFKIYKHKKEQRRQDQMHEGVNGVYYTTKQ